MRMQAELTWGIKMEWLKAGTRSDMRKTPHCWKEEEHNLIGRKGRLGEGQNVNDPSQMATTGQNWEE